MNKIVVLACAVTSTFTLVACTHFTQIEPLSSAPGNAIAVNQIVPPARSPSNKACEPRFTDVQKILLTSKPSTIEEFLKIFASSFPEFFRSYTLAYQSLSLQGSSYQNPRAIVFGQTANLIMTFNGHPSQKNYPTLELMSFDQTAGFEFRAIEFKKEANAAQVLEPNEIASSTEEYVFSKPNPHSCTLCHSQDHPRPIWENYFTWPGKYGSDDDNVYRAALLKDSNVTGSDAYKGAAQVVDSNIELDEYLKFLKRQRSDRYQVLAARPRVPTAAVLMKYDTDHPEESALEFETRPNLSLSLLFEQQMSSVIIHDILKTKGGWKNLKRIGAVLCAHPRMLEDEDRMPGQLAPYFQRSDVSTEARRNKVDRSRRDTEDLARMQSNYKNRIRRKTYEVGAEAHLSFAAEPMTQLYESHDADEATVISMKLSFDQMGLRLADYAVNPRRTSLFSNGTDETFFDLKHKILKALEARSRKPTNCENLKAALL